MNKLPLKTRVQILTMLCEGSSMRSISRVAEAPGRGLRQTPTQRGEREQQSHS